MAFPSTARRLVLAAGVFGIACGKILGFEELSGVDDSGATGGQENVGGESGNGLGGNTPVAGSNRGGASSGGGSKGGAPDGSPESGKPAGGSSTTEPEGSGGSEEPASGGSWSGGSSGAGRAGAGLGGSSAGTAGTFEDAGSGGLGDGGAIGGCERQLLVNGDFEQGRRGWIEESNFASNFQIIEPGSAPGLVEYGVTPQAGSYLAWLGGIADNEEERKYRATLKQTVIIPDEAGSLTLTGYIRIATEEVDPELDYMVAELGEDAGDNDLDVCWMFHWWWNGTSSSGWIPFTETMNLACMRGSRLFRLESRQDPTGKTSFFVDSLRLVATCGH